MTALMFEVRCWYEIENRRDAGQSSCGSSCTPEHKSILAGYGTDKVLQEKVAHFAQVRFLLQFFLTTMVLLFCGGTIS